MGKFNLNCLERKKEENEGLDISIKGNSVTKEENDKEYTDFDTFLKKINNFGRFQHIQWLLLFLTTLPQAWYSYAPVFTAMKVPKSLVTCKAGNMTIHACKTINGTTCSNRMYNTHFTSIVTDYDMFCDSSLKIAMTKSVFYIGKFIGAYFFGWLSDRYGRLVSLLSSGAVQFVVSLGQTFASNYYVYAVLRFPMGVCSGGNFMAAFLLATEMVGPGKRGFANAIIQSGYGVGVGIQAIIGYLLPKWEHHNLAITLPNILLIAYYWLTPESPRWHLAKGKRDKSEATLRIVAKVNNREFNNDVWNTVRQAEKQNDRKKYNLRHLFKTKYLTKITLIEAYSWCSVTLVYYGLGFNASNLAGNVYLNFAATGLIEIPACLMAAILVDKLGRRIPGCMYFITGGVALLIILPIQLTGNLVKLEKVVLALTLIGKFMATAAFNQVYIHTAELYPTVVRNVGLGVASASGRIGGIIAPIVTDNAPAAFSPIVFGITSLIAGILRLLLPETKDQPLLEAFDDEIGKKKDPAEEQEQLEPIIAKV